MAFTERMSIKLLFLLLAHFIFSSSFEKIQITLFLCQEALENDTEKKEKKNMFRSCKQTVVI